MPITIATAKNNQILTKQFLADGTKISEVPVKTFILEQVNPSSPAELKEVFLNLDTNQAIIAGVHKSNKTQTSKRSKDNFVFNTPWLPFDRDYITENDKDKEYIDILGDIDPQFRHISYLLKNSASNIIHHSLECPGNTTKCDCERLNPKRQKLWVQFHPSSTKEQIDTYQRVLFKKAYLKGYIAAQLSNSERAAPIVLHRTVFDQMAFQTQALSFEAIPITEYPYSHNTEFIIHNGDVQYLDPTKLTLTPLEESIYNKLIQDINLSFKDEISRRAKLIRTNHPEQDWDALDAGILTEDSLLYYQTPQGEQILPVQDLIDAMVNDDRDAIERYISIPYKDPLDPDYGDNKAKLYFNDNNTLMLHSFAHGSHYFRISPNIIQLQEALEARGYITSYNSKKERKPSKQLAQTFRAIKSLAPMFIGDQYDIDKTADDLNQVASKPAMRNLLTDTIYSLRKAEKKKLLEDNSHPLNSYSYFTSGAGAIMRYDQEEGIHHFTRAGAIEFLANKSDVFSGIELYEMWSTNPTREDVSGFGLYPPDTKNKLNMWLGFNTIPMDTTPTEEDIKPFIEFLNSLTDGDENGVTYILHWLADLIQNPLRANNVRTALVFHTNEGGTGKSTFARFIQSFFHKTNVYEGSKLSKFVGTFNSRLMPKVLICLNEIINDTGLTPNAISNILKDMWDNPVMDVEKKGIDSVVVPNRLHGIITTNHEFIYMPANDRRHSIFNPSLKYKGDLEYWNNLNKWWDENGRELVFTYLLNFNYDEELIVQSYKGISTLKAAINRLYNYDAWVFWFITQPISPEQKFSSSEVYESYDSWRLDEGIPDNMKLNQNSLTRRLKADFEGIPLSYHNQKYSFRLEKMREVFASKVLNTENMDWSEYIEEVEPLPEVNIELH